MVRAMIGKDLLRETRTGEVVLGGVGLSLTVILIFAFAFPAGAVGYEHAAAALWVAILVATQVSLSRSVEIERSNGRLETLRSLGIDPGLFYLAKSCSLFASMLLLLLPTLLACAFFFQIPAGQVPGLAGVVLLGGVGLALAGPLPVWLGSASKIREVLTPMLSFVIFIPFLITAVMASRDILEGNGFSSAGMTLAAFDFVVGGTALLLAPAVLED
ncbi:MAG: hypothetical protein D6679_09880 [Candidatus Hydrogenedentota bacterium]|nr:MAG: hypothetical protein D6679_09880 [Candidatus Hydrogenedentota bacterium]